MMLLVVASFRCYTFNLSLAIKNSFADAIFYVRISVLITFFLSFLRGSLNQQELLPHLEAYLVGRLLIRLLSLRKQLNQHLFLPLDQMQIH